MGWQDRDYNAESESGAGRFWRDFRMFLPPPATLALVLVHFIAYFVVLGVGYGRTPQEAVPLALSNGYLSPYAVLAHPIAANSGLASSLGILAIWIGGAALENLIGPNRLFTLYVLGNVFAGIGYVALAGFVPSLATAPLAIPLGAILAWTVVVARHYPYEILSLFGFSVRIIRFLLVVLAIVGLASLIRYQVGAASIFAAALTAAGAAYMLEVAATRQPLRSVRGSLRRRGRPLEPPDMEYLDDDEQIPEEEDLETSINIDDLLEKISRTGISSLSPEERDRLEQARQQRLRREEKSRVR